MERCRSCATARSPEPCHLSLQSPNVTTQAAPTSFVISSDMWVPRVGTCRALQGYGTGTRGGRGFVISVRTGGPQGPSKGAHSAYDSRL
eukprot:1392443-Prymnesium_polylepis.1